MLRLLVVSLSGVPISSLLPMPVPNWFTCVIFRARSQMKQSKSSFVVMASSIRWILRPTLIFPMFSMVVVWPRTCRLQSASPVMMFVCGIKASLTSSRCAARLVIAFKTVLLVVSDVVAVSLGIWLASVSPFNRLLLPLPLIPFLLFLHATDSVSVSGTDPSMSADEEENRISLIFPPMSLVTVLVTTSAQSCYHFCLGFQFQEACCFGFTSSVFSCDSRVFCWVPCRSPGQRAWWAAESIWFSFSLAFLLLQSLLATCLRTGGFPSVLVLVMLYSNVLILKSSGTLVLSPAPLKKWIRSPLSIRSFREICSSSGFEEESIFYAVWVYCFWKCCWPLAF